jgi:hypothetical protein
VWAPAPKIAILLGALAWFVLLGQAATFLGDLLRDPSTTKEPREVPGLPGGAHTSVPLLTTPPVAPSPQDSCVTELLNADEKTSDTTVTIGTSAIR